MTFLNLTFYSFLSHFSKENHSFSLPPSNLTIAFNVKLVSPLNDEWILTN